MKEPCCLSARLGSGHDADCSVACEHGRTPEECRKCIDMVVAHGLCTHGKPIGHWCDGCKLAEEMQRAGKAIECHGCGAELGPGGVLSPCTFCRQWCKCCPECRSSYEKGSCQLTITRCADYESRMRRKGRPLALILPPGSLAEAYQQIQRGARALRRMSCNK